MRLGPWALLPVLLLFSGCWESKTPLMPLSVRDTLPITGRYNTLPVTKGEYVVVKLIGDRRYSVTGFSKGRPEPASIVSFDEIEQLPSLAPILAQKSRVFIAQSEETEGAKKLYYYALVLVDRDDDQFLQLVNIAPRCSETVRKIVGAAPNGACVFTDYAQVNAAAIDTVRWMNDTRVNLHNAVYVRPET
jgi:hypothetical protein